jgi:uncharacterized protein (DUF2141 family)
MNFIPLILFFSLFGGFNSREANSVYTLEVIVENVTPGKGHVRICLFDNKADFFGNARLCVDVPAPEDQTSVKASFDHLEEKEHAVAVYQDFNQNGILDRNWLGLPKEPYGFSNNPSTFFGPPGFSRVAFNLRQSGSITIRL